jgi:hypothetical protein
MKKWIAKSLMVVGAIAAVAGASNAQILNGNFEADVAPTATFATGWTAGGFGTSAGNAGVRNDAFSISGNYYWINDAPGPAVGISQALTITSGTNVVINGQYASRLIGNGTNSFVVQVLDNANTVLHQSTFNPTGLGAWTNFNVTTGVINVPNVRVLFIAQGNGFDDDYMIDNIAVNPAPEPGAIALLALAVLPGVAVLRRRK